MKNNVLKKIVILVFSIFVLFKFLLPEELKKPDIDYLLSEISTKNGLPQNTVYSLAKDKDGFIWIGTDRGVVRFDGKEFKCFNSYNTHEIKNNSITSILSKENGELLIGTFGGGLLSYKNGIFSQINIEEYGNVISIWEMFIDSEQNLWVVTNKNGLIRINKSGKISNYLKGKAFNKVTSITETSAGTIFASTEKNIFKISEYKTFPVNIEELGKTVNVMTIKEFEKDGFYVGTDNGLFLGKIYKNKFKLNSKFESGNMIREVFKDKSGSLWLVTDNGLKKMDNGRVVPFLSRDLFFYTPLMTMFQGPEYGLWIGSSGSGIRILREKGFHSFKDSNNFLTGHINSVYSDSGIIVTGSEKKGILIKTGNKYYTYLEKDGLSSGHVNSVYSDINKNILVGTDNGLNVIHYPYGSILNTKITRVLSGIKILSIFKDSFNNIWIGTMGDGIYLFNGDTESIHKKSMGNISESILCITEEREGNLLIGTDKGMRFLSYKKNYEMKPINGKIIKGHVYDIYTDSNNCLWVGTGDYGLVLFNGDRVFLLGEKNKILLNPVYKIFEDKNNNIWVSTNNGLLLLRRIEIRKYIKNIIEKLNPILYSENDGISSSVFSGGSQPAGWMATDGNFYIPSKGGITYFNPEKYHFNRIVPNIVIEELVVDGEKVEITSNVVLNSGVKKISIRFSIISFANRNKVYCSYKLFGHDKKWIYASSEESLITYKNLSSGKYRLHVKAANCDGFWNNRGVTLSLRIKNPFYKTYFFYLTIILVVYFLSPFIYRWIQIKFGIKKVDGADKYKSSKLTKTDSYFYLQKLRRIVEKDKLFLDPNIKIRDISSRMGIPRKVLSQIINELLGENFKSFINKYRIEEAKKRLVDRNEADFILLKMIYDVGFNSKSVFNAAFKKYTGMSPSEFKKKHS